MPFPEDVGFAISPGESAKVGMKQQIISRMPYPYNGKDCGTMVALLNSIPQSRLVCKSE
jgi:hypothetical protein